MKNNIFGINHAQFKGKGQEAFKYLSQLKNGFVEGAFYRKELGDIDLIWGELWQEKGKIQGYGLVKIIIKHPEITAFTLNEIIEKGEIKTRNNEATQIIYKNYKVLLKQNWQGKPLKNKWIITAYAKEK